MQGAQSRAAYTFQGAGDGHSGSASAAPLNVRATDAAWGALGQRPRTMNTLSLCAVTERVRTS